MYLPFKSFSKINIFSYIGGFFTCQSDKNLYNYIRKHPIDKFVIKTLQLERTIVLKLRYSMCYIILIHMI